MSGAGYWVSILRGGVRTGAGFLLTGCYVVTAHHCLGDVGPGAEDVEVELDSGEVLPGRVHRCSPAADLALIDVPKSGSQAMIPRADRAGAGEAWQNPYRPSHSHALLTGTVDAVPVAYQCEGGDSVEAMQLGCLQDLRDYAGYSGSPIEGRGPNGESRLFGVLIEQYPDHYPADGGSRPASMVLFAATLSEVFRRFDCFDLAHLIDLLPSRADGHVPASRAGGAGRPADGPAHQATQPGIAAADAKIRALDEWQRSGLLDEQQVTALKLRVIERHLFGGDPGDQQ